MSKQIVPYVVRLIRCSNGERLPVLLLRATGLPDFDATLWVVSALRPRNLANESIAQALRSIVVLYIALESRKISLTETLRTGFFLTPADLAEISRRCAQTVQASAQDCDNLSNSGINYAKKKLSLESLRMKKRGASTGDTVAAGTVSIRLGYIREFLKWRFNKTIMAAKDESKAGMIALRDLADEELKNHTPAVTQRAHLAQRTGIKREIQAKILKISMTNNPENPWKGKRIRIRNEFIINAFLSLGLRRGELLGIRVGDFNSLTQEVVILRRPDDYDDPRLSEPNTKTRDRALPVSYELYSMLKAYLIERHESVKGLHDFLIVANNGSPMSKSEINRIFNALTLACEVKISPHILRHSFFENLADDLHCAGKDDVEITNILTRLGGWSETSSSPRRYTTRFAQERASSAAKSIQSKLYILDRASSSHD